MLGPQLFHRRAAVALAAGGLLAPRLARADAPVGVWRQIEAARAIVGDATPLASGLELDLPLVSEDGSAVSIGIEAASPMSEADHVVEVHVFAPKNPSPELLSVRLTPLAGRAAIGLRARLDGSQTVVALARTSGGVVRVAERSVQVTTSGCLARADTYETADVMKARVRVPSRFAAGEPGEILTLINHPMETGLRAGPDGRTLPRRIIQRFAARLGDRPVVEARFYRSLAANPFLRFHLRPDAPGPLRFRWEEDTGLAAEAEAAVRLA